VVSGERRAEVLTLALSKEQDLSASARLERPLCAVELGRPMRLVTRSDGLEPIDPVGRQTLGRVFALQTRRSGVPDGALPATVPAAGRGRQSAIRRIYV
jgi:hypothetical protein